jgi:hypothetical protein
LCRRPCCSGTSAEAAILKNIGAASFEADKKRFRMRLAGTVAVLLGLAVIAWLGRPFYQQFKEHRSQVQAQAFLAKGDYRSALLSARQTLQLDATNAVACRVMAALADFSHSPAVLDWQRRVVQVEPTTENKLVLATMALRYQSSPFPLTAQILDELAVTAATNLADYQVVAANLALSLHHPAEAETHYEIAIQLNPTNRVYELYLAIIRLGESDEAKAVQARAVLQKLRVDENFGPSALRALVVDRLAHKDAAAANGYSTNLLASPQAMLADQLQQLGILQQLKSGNFAAQLRSVQQQTNAFAVAQVSGWMQANGLVTDNIQWLTNLPASLQSQQPVRAALADAYMQNGDWQTLRDFASKGNWDEMEFLRLALVGRAWAQLGVAQVADSNWGAAINEAGNRYGAMTVLLGLTDQWQLKREREELLQRIVQKFPHERWAQHALEQLYLDAGDTAALRALYAGLFSVFPQDVGLKNNLAATCLLLKTNVPQACQWAEEIYAGKTHDLVIASTYAYALHLQGRTTEGLAALQKLDAHQLEEPDAALYYGVLLAATGATNEAAPYLKIARTKTQWLPEEKKLLSAALGEF